MPKTPLSTPSRYSLAAASVALATASRLLLDPVLGDRFPLLAFFAAIVVTGWYGGFGPSLLALALTWASLEAFHLHPRGSASILEDPGRFTVVFFAAGLVVSLLAGALGAARRRASADAAEARRAQEDRL